MLLCRRSTSNWGFQLTYWLTDWVLVTFKEHTARNNSQMVVYEILFKLEWLVTTGSQQVFEIFCHHILVHLICLLTFDRITCTFWLVDNLFISEPKIYVSEITKFVRAWNFGVSLSEVNNQMRFDKPLPGWQHFVSETNIL